MMSKMQPENNNISHVVFHKFKYIKKVAETIMFSGQNWNNALPFDGKCPMWNKNLTLFHDE